MNSLSLFCLEKSLFLPFIFWRKVSLSIEFWVAIIFFFQYFKYIIPFSPGIITSEKSANWFIEPPPCKFSLAAFKIHFLFFTFVSLIIMYLVTSQFRFYPFGIFWASKNLGVHFYSLVWEIFSHYCFKCAFWPFSSSGISMNQI